MEEKEYYKVIGNKEEQKEATHQDLQEALDTKSPNLAEHELEKILGKGECRKMAEEYSIKPEKNANQESIKFVEEIRETVVKTFPFISEEEKNTFVEKFNAILENKEALTNPDLLPKQIHIALATLNNTHTVLKEHKKGNQYGLEKPVYYKAGKFWVDLENGTD